MQLVVNFSGGKDSCAMLAYLVENYPHVQKHVVFADTGWEHEGAVEWCRSIVEGMGLNLSVVRNPNKTFLQMAQRRKMFPGMQTRQCTSDLKRGPIQTWIRQNVKESLIVNCMGIRSEESPGRSKAKRLSRNKALTNSKRTVWDWNPIKDWTTADVLEYLAARNIPLHPVYGHLSRFSCRLCIYMTPKDIKAVKQHDPEAIQIIDSIEKEIGFTMFQSGSITTL